MAKIQLKNIVKSWGQSVMEQLDGEVRSHEVVLPVRLVVRSLGAHRIIVGVSA